MKASRRQVFGVDFSGAETAGRAIWIAAARPGPDGLRIEDCRPAADLPGSGVSRGPALAALVSLIADRGDAAFGLDFPFSLAKPLIADETWDDFALAFTERYPTSEGFRSACRAVADCELKRLTDSAARVPFAAYNLRLYRQTFYGIGHLLAPLVRAGAACVLPMHPPAPNRPWLFEICPASTLKATGLYPSYKGRGPAPREARRAILRRMTECGALAPLPPAIEAIALDQTGGDALDSIISAVATWEATARPLADHRPAPIEEIEGRVYFAPLGRMPGDEDA